MTKARCFIYSESDKRIDMKHCMRGLTLSRFVIYLLLTVRNSELAHIVLHFKLYIVIDLL